jgi:hypothetical protein
VDLYIHSHISLHGLVVNLLSTGTTLPLPVTSFLLGSDVLLNTVLKCFRFVFFPRETWFHTYAICKAYSHSGGWSPNESTRHVGH